MVTTTSRRSSGPVLRSLSPSGRYHTSYNTYLSSSSSFASSTSSSFSSPSSTFFNHHDDDHHHHHHHHDHHHHHHRSASPTRVNLYSSTSVSPSFSFSIDRSISPNRSISVAKRNKHISFQKKSCMCSPTTHPGSFRCSLHKNSGGASGSNNNHTGSFPSNRLNMRRSAMTNSLVRIGGVEGEWMKRSLRDLIRPSSHHQKRHFGFQARPSRLSNMSKAEDL